MKLLIISAASTSDSEEEKPKEKKAKKKPKEPTVCPLHMYQQISFEMITLYLYQKFLTDLHIFIFVEPSYFAKHPLGLSRQSYRDMFYLK